MSARRSQPAVEQPIGTGALARVPVVAVVGRPNVGKSTLVNRIVGRREAIVEERPGVTRDRKVIEAEWTGHRFTLIDTGGWLADDDPLTRQVSGQAERAIAEADVLLFVLDATVGVTEEDAQVAALLRRADTPVIVVANKVDDVRREGDAWELARLGLGDPIAVSALHGRSSGDLLDALVERMAQLDLGAPAGEDAPDARAQEQPDAEALEPGAGDLETHKTKSRTRPFGVAIVGRPNVGKSTLFNRMVGEERAIVHDMPGTTRDAIDTIVQTEDGTFCFIDTAGMRKKSRIDDGPEYFGLVRALQAVDRADAVLLVIDSLEGVTQQDQRLAERVDASGCPVVVVLNKWEVLETERRGNVFAGVGDRLGFLGYAPVIKVSALTGRGVHKILPALFQARDDYERRIPTASLNRVLAAAQAAHPAPPVRGKRARVLYGTQAATEPPTFTLFATRALNPTYLRYLENRIREAFDFKATPIKVRVRVRGG